MSAHPYLVKRGFSEATISELEWRVEVLQDGARAYGLRPGVHAWVIPYRVEGTLEFERVRLIRQTDVDAAGRKKYRQPRGNGLVAYDPDGHLATEGLDHLLIIEGEANAASVRQLMPSLPVIGLPGKAGLPRDLTGVFAPEAKVWLWLDADDQGTGHAQETISTILATSGVSDLLLVGDTGGVDANDLLVAHGDCARDHINNLLVAAHPLPLGATQTLAPPLTPTTYGSFSPQGQIPELSSSLPEGSSLLPVYPDAEGHTGAVRWLAHDREAVRKAAAQVLGKELEREFPCFLPGHEGTAKISPDPATAEFRYFETGCPEAEPGGRSLAVVRAAMGYGRVVSLSGIERWTWFSRLFWEADPDLVPVADLQLPPLPDWASVPMTALYYAFSLHLRIRWADPEWHGKPVVFARDFAAAYAHLATPDDPQNKQTFRALMMLRRLGIVRAEPLAGNQRALAYLPGDGRWTR